RASQRSMSKSEHTYSGCRRLSAVSSKQNVRRVHSRNTSSYSPYEGIARVNIFDDSVAARRRDAPIGRTKPAAPAVTNRVASRRVIDWTFSLVMSSEVETSLIF